MSDDQDRNLFPAIRSRLLLGCLAGSKDGQAGGVELLTDRPRPRQTRESNERENQANAKIKNPRGKSSNRNRSPEIDQVGSRKGFCFTALRMAPPRKQRVQTFMVTFEPLGVDTLTDRRLGRKLRRVLPVILVPTPPKYLALPRVSIWLPIWDRLPQTSQTRDMSEIPRDFAVFRAQKYTKHSALGNGKPNFSEIRA